uniref:Uncharacterized protein n=1 Tax=Helianthus annuus TaxID=4232 RepID=A0A251V9W7_HELAN
MISTWCVFQVCHTYDVPYGCGINTAISNDIPNFDWKAAPWGCFCFLNLLRLCRLRRVSELFSRLEKDTRFSYFMTRTIKLICVSNAFCSALSWLLLLLDSHSSSYLTRYMDWIYN